jgi:hypothetical protein
MDPNKLAIIIAFYLSKFDKEGLQNLGYKTDSNAFEKIGETIGVKKNYIKFRRDEFDPIHPWRKGWQRPMDKRIVSAIEALQDLDESTLRQIVLNILDNEEYRAGEEIKKITNLFSDEKNTRKRIGKFILRGPTGRQAEDFFIRHYKKNAKPFQGKLIDRREFGCGYDFEIQTDRKKYFIEVKGLSEISGGILFTNKEWNTANEKGNDYFLVIIKNLNSTPDISFIQNPSLLLKAKRRTYPTIQIQWTVTDNELSSFIK